MAKNRSQASPAPFRRQQLSEEIASYVRDLIMSGRVAAGEYLRIEHLAEELNVSATPVREALTSLRAEGFVELEPNRGFRVPTFSRQDIRDIFELQAIIAGRLAAAAATRISDKAVDDLERMHQDMIEAAAKNRWKEVEELNFEVHWLVNHEAGSPQILKFLRLLTLYVPRRFYEEVRGWPQDLVDDYGPIVAAIASGQSETAGQAMQTHVAHAGDLLLEHLWDRGLLRDALEPNDGRRLGQSPLKGAAAASSGSRRSRVADGGRGGKSEPKTPPFKQ